MVLFQQWIQPREEVMNSARTYLVDLRIARCNCMNCARRCWMLPVGPARSEAIRMNIEDARRFNREIVRIKRSSH